MKKYFLFFVLLSLSFFSKAQGFSEKDYSYFAELVRAKLNGNSEAITTSLEKRGLVQDQQYHLKEDILFYKKDKSDFLFKLNVTIKTPLDTLVEIGPFMEKTGTFLSFHLGPDSRICLTDYKNGKKHGIYQEFSKEGNILRNAVYDHDSIFDDRHFEPLLQVDPTDAVQLMLSLVDPALKDSSDVLWLNFSNRYKVDEMSFNAGSRVLEYTQADNDSVLFKMYLVEKESVLLVTYNKKHPVQAEGIMFTFDVDSVYLKQQSSYHHGQRYGEEIEFYPSGVVKRRSEFAMNEKHGIEKIFRENGTLFMEGEYQKGLKNGIWIEYAPDGKHQENQTQYQMGQLIP